MGDKAQRQPSAAQKGNHEKRQAWETRRQQHPRATQKGYLKGDKLGRDKAAAEEHRREIMKGDKLGDMKGDKGDKAESSTEANS